MDLLFQHRTQICTGYHAGIAAEPASLDVGLRRNVLCLALGQHLVADLQCDLCVGDIDVDEITLEVSDEVLAERKAKYVAPEPNVKTGWLSRYARMVTSADEGAVLR